MVIVQRMIEAVRRPVSRSGGWRRSVAATASVCRQWVFALSLLGIACAAHADATIWPDSDESLYRAALEDLNQGNTQQAIGKLDVLVARNPSHAGAMLDLAIAYCQSDRPAKAEPLFGRLNRLPELPPAIGDLIAYYRDNCRPTSVPWRGFAAIGFGRADNLNQSPGTDYFFLSSLGLSLQLAEIAWPRSDNFRVVEAALFRYPQEQGWGGAVSFQGVDYRRANEYDTALWQASVGYRYKTEEAIRLEAQGIANRFLLGGESYLSSLSLNLSAMMPLSAQGSWQFGAVGSVTSLDYLTLPDYQSLIVEERLRLKWQPLPQLNLLGEAGWTHDGAKGNRPGGSKRGPVAQLIAQWELMPRHSLELINRQAWLSDETAYSPLFFGDEKRRSHLSSWYLAWRYQLPDNFRVRLEARRNASQDAIELFDYRSSSLGILLEWGN